MIAFMKQHLYTMFVTVLLCTAFTCITVFVLLLSWRAFRYFDAILSKTDSTNIEQLIVDQYTLDTNQGSVIHDVYSDKTGSIHGASWTDGSKGTSLFFDGNDQYISFTDSQFPEYRKSKGITLETWVFVPKDNPEYPQHTDQLLIEDANKNYLYYLVDKGRFKFRCMTDAKDDIAIETSRIDTQGRWVHVAATYDGFRMRIYVDGKLEASHYHEGSLSSLRGILFLAGNPDHYAKFFRGKLDNVTLYTEALSQNVILNHANQK